MTETSGNRSQRHDAIVAFLMTIPIEQLRDQLQKPDEFDRRLAAEVGDYSFGEFVVALKETADRQQRDADELLAEAKRLASLRKET